MMRLSIRRINRLVAVLLALPAAACAKKDNSAAYTTALGEHQHAGEAQMQSSQIRIPESMQAEHTEIHSELVRATSLPGQTGVAARALAAVLDPHFKREEQIALPPLGLLAPLSRNEFTPDMLAVLPMTDSLRAELGRMLEEHKAIGAATKRLGDVARADGNARVAQLADQLTLHAQNEEQISYPAALLVGEVVRLRSAAATHSP
jgi:hypothetical protein